MGDESQNLEEPMIVVRFKVKCQSGKSEQAYANRTRPWASYSSRIWSFDSSGWLTSYSPLTAT